MEAKNINYNEEWLKGGLILAGVSILLTMLTYVIDVSLMVEWWFGVVSLLISMGLLIYLGINYRNDIGGILSYGDAFKFSFLVFFVSYVVGIIFQIALYTVIDPELPETIISKTLERYLKAYNILTGKELLFSKDGPLIIKSLIELYKFSYSLFLKFIIWSLF